MRPNVYYYGGAHLHLYFWTFSWICRADQEAGGRSQLVIAGLEVDDGGGEMVDPYDRS